MIPVTFVRRRTPDYTQYEARLHVQDRYPLDNWQNAIAPDPPRDSEFFATNRPPGRESAMQRISYYWNPALWCEDRFGAVGAPGYLPASNYNGQYAHAEPVTLGKVPIVQGGRTPRGRLLHWVERVNMNPNPSSSYSSLVDYFTGAR